MRIAPTSTAAASALPSRAQQLTAAIARSVVHCVDHTPALRQWSSRRRNCSAATSGSPTHASMDALDVPAMPITNDVPVRSARSIARAKRCHRELDVAVQLGFAGAVPGERGEGCLDVAVLCEQRFRRRPRGRVAEYANASTSVPCIVIASACRASDHCPPAIELDGLRQPALEEGLIAERLEDRGRRIDAAPSLVSRAIVARRPDFCKVPPATMRQRLPRSRSRRRMGCYGGVGGDDLVGPRQDVGTQAQEPEVLNGDHDPSGRLDVPCGDEPGERHGQIGDGGIDLMERPRSRLEQAGVRRLHPLQGMQRMATGDLVRRPSASRRSAPKARSVSSREY